MPETALHIALLTHSVNPRGGVVHVLELGRALHEAGHHVTVMAPAAPGQRLFRTTPCAVELVPVAPAGGQLAELVRSRIDGYVAHLAKLLPHRQVDIWHAHDGIGANALADLAARGAIRGYLRTVHHVDRFDDARVQAWEERSVREASRVLCVSELWRQRLADDWGIAAERVTNGIDLARYSPQAQPLDRVVARKYGLGGGPRLLCVGGIESRKNARRLLAAFLALRAQRPSAQLVIAGGASVLNHDAETRAFHADVEASGLSIGPGCPLVITGTVPDAEMPSLYRLADVLAMPSLLEGFGLAALEALASGTPAVVSRSAPFTEHFGDGDVEWADPLDVDSIALALQRALALGRREPPAVCRRFDWPGSAAAHLRIYRHHLAATRLPALAH